jgi:P27 family predicted phage terminase small subunit
MFVTGSHTPPPHLRAETKAWFDAVVGEYVFEAHHVRLLVLACEAWDRCTEAREQLARDGLTVAGREGGTKTHPCVAIERDSRAAFASLVKVLGLDDVTDKSPRGVGRPGYGGFGVTMETLRGLPPPAEPGKRPKRRA